MKKVKQCVFLLSILTSSLVCAEYVTVRALKKWSFNPPNAYSNSYHNQKWNCDRGDELELIEYTTNGAINGYLARGNQCTVVSSWIPVNGSLSPEILREFKVSNSWSLSSYRGCVAAVTLDCY